MRKYWKIALCSGLALLVLSAAIPQVRAFIGGGRISGGPANDAGHASHQAIANSNGLVDWLRFDGDAKDSSASVNNGNLNNFTLDGTTNGWKSGKFGGSLLFNGTSDYVMNSSVISTSTVTNAAWIYLSAYPSTSTVIAGFATGNGSGTYDKDLTVNSIGQLYFYAYLGLAGSITTSAPSVFIPLNQWVFVAGTYDGTTANAYVNGAVVGTNSISGTSYTGYGGADVLVGGTAGSYTSYFNGMMDDVRIYNRALSAPELTRLYAGSPPPPVDQTLVGYWKMDETSGTTITDSIGGEVSNAFNGTPSAQSGVYSGAYKFNGSADYITVPHGTAPDLTGTEMTASAWIYPTATFGGNYASIVARGGYNLQEGYELTVQGNLAPCPTINTVSNHPAAACSPSAFSVLQWHLLTMTYKTGSPGTLKVYMDGVPTASAAASGAILTATSPTNSDIYIGRRDPANTSGTYWPGLIDDVRIYNRALSAAEVYDLYLAGK
jgi:hypothetical protein